ncbi:hypothetical protein SDRG_11435 [Saprolegnia diclina VS20]|uniref:Ferric reductase NAD binding domain-containing protein n=1 Tax=Saprolegnia diclina (strain VS20) TaxID=1156394 RepID=T0RM16_SAPDV|nr:hypothetical protein SDRG_11435 [Saprolegnia diclina VS20]EQC30962.1 hypothetical protein SDRG_11435 [Saprolegnia diclina VS20]|eukprot:XP_008615700.1 hypothetical protein SDRG_11435 [Saprolegnia diclina VS20]
MAVMSLPVIRRRSYATFKAAHFLFVPATLFAVLHWGPIIAWVFMTMVLYIANKVLSAAFTSAPVAVVRAVAHDHVHACEGRSRCQDWNHLARCGEDINGVTELVLATATTYAPVAPVSITSAPVTTPETLAVHIKVQGHWTRQLHAYVAQCTLAETDPILYADTVSSRRGLHPAPFDTLVFVAGGIGVTPLLGLLVDAVHATPAKAMHLVWHVRDVRLLHQFESVLDNVVAKAPRLHLHVTQAASEAIDVLAETTTTVFDRGLPRRMWVE